VPPAPDPRDDEGLGELPPLDGDLEDERPVELPPDDRPDTAEDTGGLDDSTGEDDPLDAEEVELDDCDEGWLNEQPDASDLDLGPDSSVDDIVEESAFADHEEPGVAGEDFGLTEGPDLGGLDAGDEGPSAPDEEVREEDLPALDADDEGEADPEPLPDLRGSEEPAGLPWADRPWARVGAPVPLVTATAVACAARWAVIAGKNESGSCELLRVDLEGASQTLRAEGLPASELRAVSVDDELIAVVGAGRLFVSDDGGARFEPHGKGVAIADAWLAHRALWARTKTEGLVVSLGPHRPPVRRPVPGAVAALAVDAKAGAVALVVDEARRPIALVRGRADGSLDRDRVGPAPPCDAPLLAVRGRHVAYAGRRCIVVRERDGTWKSVPWEGSIAAMAFLDDAGRMLVATCSDSDDMAALVRLDEMGKAAVVARLGTERAGGEGEEAPFGLAVDDLRGVVWVAGPFGVAAFAVSSEPSEG
jgi:hypothetical protein